MEFYDEFQGKVGTFSSLPLLIFDKSPNTGLTGLYYENKGI